MIKMYVEHLLNHSIDIIGAFNKKVYEAAVLKIMNDSQNVFPNIYEHVNIQSNGECDFFDKTTGVKFDAKLPFDEKQIKLYDLNKDGVITVVDSTLVQKIIVGLIKEPTEEQFAYIRELAKTLEVDYNFLFYDSHCSLDSKTF